MKIIVAIITFSILSGCAVSNAKWSDAEVLCKSFSGVKSVLTYQSIAECNHGVYVQRAR